MLRNQPPARRVIVLCPLRKGKKQGASPLRGGYAALAFSPPTGARGDRAAAAAACVFGGAAGARRGSARSLLGVFVLGAFVPRVASWGVPSRFFLVFLFRWGPSPSRVASVACFAPSRPALARLLWRFRRARRWWRSSAAPPRGRVWPDDIRQFGLRWLACRPLLLTVFAGRFARFRPLPPRGGCRFVLPRR